MTRTNGTVSRAIFQSNAFALPNAGLQFQYTPSSNTLIIKNNQGAVLFQGPLTGAMRTG